MISRMTHQKLTRNHQRMHARHRLVALNHIRARCISKVAARVELRTEPCEAEAIRRFREILILFQAVDELEN